MGYRTMELNGDVCLDCGDELPIDDEESLAQRVFNDDDDDIDDQSDHSPWNSSYCCIDADATSWPQSYRQSTDMLANSTPPSVSFMNGTSLTRAQKRRHQDLEEQDSSLGQSLIPSASVIEDDRPPLLKSQPSPKLSVSESPPLQEQCSFTEATLNGINVLCGIGILTVPYAIHQGGWSGLVLLVLVSIVAGYTGILLKRCLDSSSGLKTYPDIGHAAFGIYGRLAIAIVLYLELYASCVEHIIMMGDNLASLFPNAGISVSCFNLDPHQTFAIATTLLVLPTVWLRNLGVLAYLSVGGVVASILVAVCLVWVGTVDGIGFHSSGTAINLVNLPFTLGIFGFCYSGHSVFPNIYASMRKPSQFSAVVIVSFCFCLFIYAGTAVCGFLMFGDSIKSQFTLNMPTKFVATKIAIWTTVVNPLAKYALTLMPVCLSLEELLPSTMRTSYGPAIFIRTVLTFSTLVVALTVPFFSFVMALMGSLLAMLVALIFPCACYLRLLRVRLSKIEIGVCWFTIALGVFSAIAGTYSAIAELNREMG